jgi:predicted house-cleaning noncanonical NTP pyrophosphatase (MazG superfamily)
MTLYNKLVRDKIPELIRRQGREPMTRVLTDEEFARCLSEKLDEEVAEFHRDQNIEELADILEVVFALTATLGASRDELMDVYEKKHEALGGFEDRVFLIGKE